MNMNTKTLAKLSQARVEICKAGLKKSGNNTFSHYDYYELKDILPKILEVCNNLHLCPIVQFGSERTTLTVYDTEVEDSGIEFSCDSIRAIVKGAADIQNEGAKQTYLRRYLYMAAFEIAEADTVEIDAKETAEHAGGDMRRQELLNELKKYGLTVQKLVAYKGSLENIPTEYLEDQLKKRKEREAAKEQAQADTNSNEQEAAV